MRKYIYIALAVLFLSSCGRDIVYSRFAPIPSEKWHADSVLRLDYTIADTTASYQMILYLRHTDHFPYQNMWLFVSEGARQDTIEFYLADDRGQWLGDKKHGFVEMPVLLEENRHFADTGHYCLEVQHAMRDTLLRGVMDVGLEIIRNGQE